MNTHTALLAQSTDAPPLAGGPVPAQNSGTTGAPGSPTGAPPQGGFDIITLMIFGLLFAFVISAMLGGRREKKKFEKMMAGIKRNDQVRTVGGIIGSVVEVKPDVVVLKVDENNNTKLTVARTKIEAVLKESVASAE